MAKTPFPWPTSTDHDDRLVIKLHAKIQVHWPLAPQVLNRIQPGAVLWRNGMHLNLMHLVTSVSQFHCTRLYISMKCSVQRFSGSYDPGQA